MLPTITLPEPPSTPRAFALAAVAATTVEFMIRDCAVLMSSKPVCEEVTVRLSMLILSASRSSTPLPVPAATVVITMSFSVMLFSRPAGRPLKL